MPDNADPQHKPGFAALMRTSFAPLMHRLALGFLLLGLALTVGGGEEGLMILTLIGVVALAAGVLASISWWRARGWKLGYLGVVIGVMGVVFVGAAFDEASCDCRSVVYFGVALVAIGAAAAIGRARAGSARPGPGT